MKDMNDFEIIRAALTGWDAPEPVEVPPARAALDRIEEGVLTIMEALQKTRDASAAVHALGRLVNP
jgi:hypothetical protein